MYATCARAFFCQHAPPSQLTFTATVYALSLSRNKQSRISCTARPTRAMMLSPAFTFKLNQKMVPRLVTVGRYDESAAGVILNNAQHVCYCCYGHRCSSRGAQPGSGRGRLTASSTDRHTTALHWAADHSHCYWQVHIPYSISTYVQTYTPTQCLHHF